MSQLLKSLLIIIITACTMWPNPSHSKTADDFFKECHVFSYRAKVPGDESEITSEDIVYATSCAAFFAGIYTALNFAEHHKVCLIQDEDSPDKLREDYLKFMREKHEHIVSGEKLSEAPFYLSVETFLYHSRPCKN